MLEPFWSRFGTILEPMLVKFWRFCEMLFDSPLNAERGERSEPSEARTGWFFHTQVDARNKQKARAGRQTHAHNQAEKCRNGWSGLFSCVASAMSFLFLLVNACVWFAW